MNSAPSENTGSSGLITKVKKVDVVIQNVASFRIDPAVLARPDRMTVLVTSPVNRERLRSRGRDDAFATIVVTDDFSEHGLANIVARLTAEAGFAPEDVRLLCHDEYSLANVAAVREKLHIPGDSPAELEPFTDKLLMKSALSGKGIRMPRHMAWDADAYRRDPDSYAARVVEAIGLPSFVKPVNESGSVGATTIYSERGLHDWARHAAGYEFEIDEFLSGTLYHVDSAVHDGQIRHVRVNQYMHPCHEYSEGRICSTFTLPEEDPNYGRLVAFNEQVLSAFTAKPRNGVFHHEVFRLPGDELVFLEIAARAPAALAPATGRIRWGLDIEEAHFRLQRGEEVNAPSQRGPYAAFAYFPKRAGKVTARHLPAVESPHRWNWNVSVGDTLDRPTDIRDFAASILMWNDDFATLQRDLRRLDQHTALTVR